jgi:hypothetical protein
MDNEPPETTTTNEKKKKSDDLFEFFDPRISPHMYPGGIQAQADTNTNANTNVISNALLASDQEVQSNLEEAAANANAGNSNVQKIGILLMDHGSKRETSNAHLNRLAAQYQSNPKCPPHFLVEAAHMEIAPPNIEQGIRTLISKGACAYILLLFALRYVTLRYVTIVCVRLR